jgi:hypothetical protein
MIVVAWLVTAFVARHSFAVVGELPGSRSAGYPSRLAGYRVLIEDGKTRHIPTTVTQFSAYLGQFGLFQRSVTS